MDEVISRFIESRNIAIIGASTSKKKFGNVVYRELKSKGYTVFPVNPNAESVEGDRTYPDVKSLPPKVDAAVVVTPPDLADRIVEEAISHGLKKIWFQQGAESAPAVEKALEAGLDVVSKKCIMMYAPPVKGFHSFHRFLAGIFKRL
ncbi:CoA-binding protein [Acidobacteriota bacterium]